MKRLLLIVSVALFMTMSACIVSAATLDFDDADGTYWNGSLYGEPIFGPGEPENYYHGFYLEGWRVFDKDGVAAVYGTGSLFYLGTNGDRSIGRTSFDQKFISNADDFYFEGASLGAEDHNNNGNPVIIELVGFNDGSQVWYETVQFNWTGAAEVKNFISSYADVLVDSVRFNAWEVNGYSETFILDDFQYTSVPVPGALFLLGSGLIGLLGFRKRFIR
jgi:hypothetical protein